MEEVKLNLSPLISNSVGPINSYPLTRKIPNRKRLLEISLKVNNNKHFISAHFITILMVTNQPNYSIS
jgi:hypothetical protein